MTTIIIVILTILLILDCLLLGLLVLVQLPKKDAGVGMAFGGGAADALFGAGSGNTLTKLTKYTAGIFFVLVFLLSTLNIKAARSNGSDLRKALGSQTQPATAQPGVAAQPNAAAAVGTNAEVMSFPATNAASAAATNTGTNAPK